MTFFRDSGLVGQGVLSNRSKPSSFTQNERLTRIFGFWEGLAGGAELVAFEFEVEATASEAEFAGGA
jgi:hypothetical protein